LAYNFIPNSEKEIKNEILNNNEIIELYRICCFYSKTTDPLAIDLKNITSIKITRLLTDKFKNIISDFKSKNIKIKLGNGSRGNTGANNLGLKFEKDLYNDFLNYLEQDYKNVIYKDFIHSFYVENKLFNLPNINITLDACKNTKRPLQFKNNYIYIGNEEKLEDIGKSLSDITISSGTTYQYLSLKYGNTATLFNIGCKKIFKSDEISNNYIVNKEGKLFLDIFGISENLFCNQFNTLSGNGEIKINHSDNTKIQTFLKTGIGCNYHLLHLNNNIINSTYITKKYLNEISKVNDIKIIYPKYGKKINIHILNKYIKINVNIRNKSGGLFPTHIMGDYKLLHSKGE